MNEDLPPLKLLHPESTLIPGKLILEGNHRIHVLRMRGVDVDKLPRDIVAKTEL
jgi:hypothetical protein